MLVRLRAKCRQPASLWQCSRDFATGKDGETDSGGKSKENEIDSGGKKKDFSIDFTELFKTVGNKGADKKDPDINFSKLFKDASRPEKKAGDNKGDGKFNLDLAHLFSKPDSKPAGDGGLKGFKLDLTRIKGSSSRSGGSDSAAGAAGREISVKKLEVLKKFSRTIGGANVTPPKDDLLERFFSVENMSSGERTKLELKAAREAFKLHDSDVGSSPVQIAALTRRIQLLNPHFAKHRKDKYGLRRFEAIIERRRRLLIYLRRTDWDMYCHVITRLNLRDKLDIAQSAGKYKKSEKKRRKKRMAKKKRRVGGL